MIETQAMPAFIEAPPEAVAYTPETPGGGNGSTAVEAPASAGVIEAAEATAPSSEEVAPGLMGLPGRVYTYYRQRRNAHHMVAFRAGHAFKTYSNFCSSRGWSVENAPSDALIQCARASWRPAGQNASAHVVLDTLTVVRELGLGASEQVYENVKMPPKRREPVNGEAVERTNDSGGFAGAAPVGAYPTPAPTPTPVAPPAPQPLQGMRATAQRVKGSPLPVGGRVRIYKVATGYEGAGIAPGQRIGVGEYLMDDVSGEGPIQNWLSRWVVPNFGPKAGQSDTTYIVEKLDDRGQIQSAFSFAFAAPVGQAAGQPGSAMPPFYLGGPVPPGPTPGPGFAPPPYSPAQASPRVESPTEQRFIEYLLSQQQDQQRRYEEVAKTLQEQKTDPAMMMLLLERAKPQPIPWERVLTEMRRSSEPAFPPPSGPSGQAPLTIMDPFASMSQPSQMQPIADALVRTTEKVMEMSRAPQAAPPAPPAPPPPDPFSHPLVGELMRGAIAKMNAPHAPSQSPVEAKLDKVLDYLLKPPEKSRTISEQLGDMKAMVEAFREISGGGEDRANPIVETVGMLIENADKVGELVKSFAGFDGKAPPLPKKEQKKALPAGQSQQTQKLTLPEDAQKALIALNTAPEGEAGEQAVADAVFGLVGSLLQAPEPFPRLGQLVINAFNEADSKPELRAMVVNILVKCGAKKLAADPSLVEKVAAVLHKHYGFIFASLNGGKEKKLLDAEEPTPPAKATVDSTASAPAKESTAPMVNPPVASANGETDEEDGEEEGEGPAQAAGA